MVSSKFARSKHNFRIPDVCKKKLEAEEGPPPPIGYPPDPEYFTYDVDLICYGVPRVFSGVLTMHISNRVGDATRWEAPRPYPTNGEWAYLIHDSGTGDWSYYFMHIVGGYIAINAIDWGNIPNSPDNLGLGDFEITFPGYCNGKRDGNISA